MTRRTAASASLSALVAGCLLALPAAAQAVPSARAETLTFVLAGAPGTAAVVHARGAIRDDGKLTPTDGDVDTLVFKDGTLRIRETLTTKVGYPKPPLCVTTFRSSGVVRIVGGTGRFAGLAGRGTASDTGLTVGPGKDCRRAPVFVADQATMHLTLAR